MKYLLLLYQDARILEGRSPEESARIYGEYMDYTSRIHRNGNYVAGEALAPISTARTVRQRNGKMLTTDGPFAETKEQLGGYYLIDAKDLNDAIQVASKIPSAKFGSIEVRPIQEFN